MEERSRLMTRRNTRRSSRAIGLGGIPLKMEAAKDKEKEKGDDGKTKKEKTMKKKTTNESEEENSVKQISSVLGMVESSKHKQVQTYFIPQDIFERSCNVKITDCNNWDRFDTTGTLFHKKPVYMIPYTGFQNRLEAFSSKYFLYLL